MAIKWVPDASCYVTSVKTSIWKKSSAETEKMLHKRLQIFKIQVTPLNFWGRPTMRKQLPKLSYDGESSDDLSFDELKLSSWNKDIFYLYFLLIDG